jgi:hypothetical protein
MADNPPRPIEPHDVKIDGQPEVAEMTTKSMDGVTVSAIVDSAKDQQVKLLIHWSANDFKTFDQKKSDYGKRGRREALHMPNLKHNTLYKVRLWTLGAPDDKSKNPNVVSFWTNRNPDVTLVTPVENSEYDESQIILFDWKYDDADSPQDVDQAAWRLRYRSVSIGANGNNVLGDWVEVPGGGPQEGKDGKDTFHRFDATKLVANTTYLWTVKARDKQGLWSDWPLPNSFFVRGVRSPPVPVSPDGGLGHGVPVGDGTTVTFSWRFRSGKDSKQKQVQADIRWRVVGTGDVGFVPGNPDDQGDLGWVTRFGKDTVPGSDTQWDISGANFQAGFLYEWQVRTYPDKEAGVPSGWSVSAKFMATLVPGSANVDPPLAEETDPLGELGCGHHRVFIYDQPKYDTGLGRYVAALRGEIKPLARVQWGRKRDDIGNCLITTNGFDQDCCELLGELRSWAHEVVIFRDDVRVFEGPITRITYTSTDVEIEAKDVMAYLYRRVMRQGYNDRYRRIDLTPNTPPKPIDPDHPNSQKGGPYEIIGVNTVVQRALQIALNALAYRDPAVLPYLTAITYPGDAPEQRVVYDYQKTAWEEIDDMAATAGLDYTTVGRRIMFWDTHRTIGRLPEMRDGDFSDPVIVTEYGMNLSNWYAVTNNTGVAGVAYPHQLTASNWADGYGPVEMVSSAYGEQQGSKVSTDALSPAEKAKLVDSFTKQAKRGVASRYPTPVVVRVPDNSALNPQVNLSINHLIPGVWIPLRATLTCRKLAQWQKLDSVDVEEIAGVEQVRVTMSPAPHGGDDDPDLSGDVEAS